MKRLLALCGAAALLTAGPVSAGEVNGSKKNPKEDFSQGVSLCKFSGLNDVPEGSPTEGPAGRVQSFGQDVAVYGADPTGFNPGMGCNPNFEFPE